MNFIEQKISPVFQTEKKPTLKESYGFISTRKLIERLENKGFTISSTKVQNVRNVEREGYQKHLLIMKHNDFKIKMPHNHEVIPQLCLLNSHDGTSSLRLFFGMLRIACLNDLIAGQSIVNARVVHSGNLIKDLDSKLDLMIENFPQLVTETEKLVGYTPNAIEVENLVDVCFKERLKNIPNIIKVDKNIYPRRIADTNQDLFTIFNRIQEKTILGGIVYVQENKKEVDVFDVYQRESKVTRKLTGIGKNISMNQFLWDEAAKLVA